MKRVAGAATPTGVSGKAATPDGREGGTLQDPGGGGGGGAAGGEGSTGGPGTGVLGGGSAVGGRLPTHGTQTQEHQGIPPQLSRAVRRGRRRSKKMQE